MAPPLHILWRDEHLVALYKPAGWLVHRTGLDAGETRFVVQTLRDQLGQRVYPVHRLDKGTCGVLVMALHSDAARALAQAFEQQRTHKRYVALVRGWLPDAAEVDHALQPDDAPQGAPAQDAHTRFRCLARLELAEAFDARHAGTRAVAGRGRAEHRPAPPDPPPPQAPGAPDPGRRHARQGPAQPLVGRAPGPDSGCGCTPRRSRCRTR